MRQGAKGSLRQGHVACAAGLLAGLFTSLASCSGRIGDVSGGTPGEPGGAPGGNGGAAPSETPGAPFTSFSCDPSASAPPQAWRKVGALQYRNTLRDLLAFGLRDANTARAIMGDLAGALDRIPPDERQKLPEDLHGSFRRLDQAVAQSQVDATYDVAVAAGAALAQRVPALAGPCAADADVANDAACLTDFVTRFGARALRRPLTGDEVTLYRAFAFQGASPTIDPAGIADVVAAFLTAPQFLYHVEHGETPVPGKADVFTLTAFELANRLSYHFWNSMPDNTLWDAAATGALLAPAELARQVDRLLADPRARPAIDEFYRDWLKLDDLPPLDSRSTEPVFRRFAGDDLPQASLRGAMIEDVLDLARHFTWTEPAGTFDDLMLSDRSFARAPELAKIYGVAAWTGGDPPSFAAGQRPGLLTRAALLATGSPQTRPIKKGVFARESILCDALPPPPNNAAAAMAELSPTLSTRQVVEALTEAQGSACAACHATFINPIGFATEGFDALGRQRQTQRLFSERGDPLGEAPVNTTVVPQIVTGDPTTATGPRQLVEQIVASGKAHACFVRNYFRFTFTRWDSPAADGCALEGLRQSLRGSGGSLRAVFRQVALLPEFAQRRF